MLVQRPAARLWCRSATTSLLRYGTAYKGEWRGYTTGNNALLSNAIRLRGTESGVCTGTVLVLATAKGLGRLAVNQEVGSHLPFALDLDLATALEHVRPISKELVHFLCHLCMVGQSSGVHATGDIDRVAPDIILWLPCSDDSRNHWTNVEPNSEHEIVVGIFVDVSKAILHGEHQLCHGAHVACPRFAVIPDARLWHEPNGGHVGTASGLDLVDGFKPFAIQQLQGTGDQVLSVFRKSL